LAWRLQRRDSGSLADTRPPRPSRRSCAQEADVGSARLPDVARMEQVLQLVR
jgi:hypothetical protein